MNRTVWAGAVMVLAACTNQELKFTGRAIESLPQRAVLSGALSTGESIAGQVQLAEFFEQECHMPDEVNYCPPGVDVKQNGGFNNSKFTVNTLLGLVYHAEMYSGGLKTNCSGTSGPIAPSSFVSATAEGSDPDRYILDYFPLLSCRTKEDRAGHGNYQAFSVDPKFQATLTTRYKVPFSGGGLSHDQTDVFQVYVSVDANSVPTFLAFNWAGVSSMTARAILLVNLATHRFAVKYLSGPASTLRYVDAVGVGGIDRASGQAHPGYYHARFSGNAEEAKAACVNNADQVIEVDDSACAAAQVPISWTSSATIADYLQMSADEQIRLAAFLAKFETPDVLAASESPHIVEDADRYFPQRIE